MLRLHRLIIEYSNQNLNVQIQIDSWISEYSNQNLNVQIQID